MKTLIQKVHVEEYHSFACRTYRTPNFETAWHKHPEYELILITEGTGTALIGNYIGEYKSGDIFFLDSNLPHWFRKSKPKMTGSAIVIQFLRNFWGSDFLQMPEVKNVRGLLDRSGDGIQLQHMLLQQITTLIRSLENASGIERIFLLMECLQKIGTSKQYKIITTAFETSSDSKENSTIEKIIDYSFKHFLEPVSLKEVAEISGLSIPSFCRFFKRNIKKSYFDFLKELRIGHACKLLRETNNSILDICYASGYNSWAHFSKQFRKVTNMTPSQFRKQHLKP